MELACGRELTLKRWTSSIVAVLPSDTQEWKKDGATDTPRASEVIPVPGNVTNNHVTVIQQR